LVAVVVAVDVLLRAEALQVVVPAVLVASG
jgi:hypothetical protein